MFAIWCGDKRDLFLKNDELRKQFSIISKRKGIAILKQVEDLRNSLAHSQQDISSGLGWESLFETVQWMEEFISTSDVEIENRAKSKSKKFQDGLW